MFDNHRLERRINRLERKLDAIIDHLGIAEGGALPGFPEVDYRRIDQLLVQGKKIQAIKIYREQVPEASLVEAKRVVEAREG